MFNPMSLKYLVQHAWGLSNSYLFEIENRMKNILSKFNADNSYSESYDLMLFVMPSMDKYFNGDRLFYRLVIDCYNTAEKKHRQLLVCCEHVQEKIQ